MKKHPLSFSVFLRGIGDVLFCLGVLTLLAFDDEAGELGFAD